MWWGQRKGPEPAEDSEWAGAVAGCLAVRPRYFPAIHPDKHIPSAELTRLSALVVPPADACDHPAVIALSSLTKNGEGYEGTVPVRLIRGVAEPKGKIVFDLGRLPETMDLLKNESFGPLDSDELTRLWQAIKDESGAIDAAGRIKLDLQTWDGCYVARNCGASRRLALWCRLQSYWPKSLSDPQPVTTLPAWITPIDLNPATMFFFREHSRILFTLHDPALEAAVTRLHALDADFLYLSPADAQRANGADRPAAIVLPMLHRIARERLIESVLLQHWVADLFDVGRYLAERGATYNSNHR